MGNIAVVVFGTEDPLPNFPAIGPALDGIERALAGHGRDFLFANVPKGDRVPPFLSGHHVEGVVIVGPVQGLLPPESECPLLQHLYACPHVWLLGRAANARGDQCSFDPDAAAKLAADHLVQLGHSKVGFFHAASGQIQSELLKHTFLAAARHRGVNPTVLEGAPPSHAKWPVAATASQDAVERLLDTWVNLRRADRPTAVFVPSDRTTVQLYAGAARRGIRMGRDLSVVSCQNERSLIGDLVPAVTSIDLNAEFIGDRAITQLLWRIQHRDALSVRVLVEPTLAVRNSVARM